jgi:hypothetical protein
MIVIKLADALPTDKCENCGHGPAYHDGDGGHICRAWTDETPDFFCACPGWKLTAFDLSKKQPC